MARGLHHVGAGVVGGTYAVRQYGMLSSKGGEVTVDARVGVAYLARGIARELEVAVVVDVVRYLHLRLVANVFHLQHLSLDGHVYEVVLDVCRLQRVVARRPASVLALHQDCVRHRRHLAVGIGVDYARVFHPVYLHRLGVAGDSRLQGGGIHAGVKGYRTAVDVVLAGIYYVGKVGGGRCLYLHGEDVVRHGCYACRHCHEGKAYRPQPPYVVLSRCHLISTFFPFTMYSPLLVG